MDEAPGGRKPRPEAAWLLLDRFVHRVWRHGDVEWDATSSATAHDCVGRPIRASLRVAGAPAVSRLHLHWPTRPEYVGMVEPAVIAVHRHSILFQAKVPFDEDPTTCDEVVSFPRDYFVYSAASSPPSLTRLPSCFIGGSSNPDEDIYFKPYRRRQQRAMLDENIGLLCHGVDGEFTVAELTKCCYREAELCLLHHRPTASSGEETPPQWRIKKLRISDGIRIRSWTTDTVVPAAGRFLCWVDNYQGMLLVDVLLANDESRTDQQQLRFIPLPREALRSPRIYTEDSPDPARCVGVADNGMIKLVCITNGGSSRWHNRYAFTVTSWTLVDIRRGRWRRDHRATVKHAEFFRIYDMDRCLPRPRVMPSFPMVSLVDPDVVCFLLEEDRDTTWIIQVDLRKKVLQSRALYIRVEEEEGGGCPNDIRRKNIFGGHSFIPSQLPTYFSKDAIKRPGTKRNDAEGKAMEGGAKGGYIGGTVEGAFNSGED
ncbi:hypothetical protein ACP70R_007977 [Stipagrostis hirtigluma subsp. patula]